MEAIETLQSRLYGISQKLSEKQEEQHDAIHKRALKQIKYLQELQNYQMDSQFDYVKKMKHALEDELRDTQLRVLESESSIESQSPNVSKAFETEVGTDNEPIIRKVKRKRAKGNFESKITSLMEEKFSLIQAEFEECIQEIHHLQDKLVKGSDTQRTVHVSPAPLRPSSEHPKSTATGLSDYQSVTKNIQDALSWSPLDDLIVLKKPFVVPNEESKSGKHNDSSAVSLLFFEMFQLALTIQRRTCRRGLE